MSIVRAKLTSSEPKYGRMPRVFWFVLAAMLVVWLIMNLGTAPRIEEMAGGLRLLDMRLTGYSFDDARNFVAALGSAGIALYLNLQLWLDTLFPPLLGAILFMSFRWLYPGWPGVVIGTLSLSSIAVDYLENAAIAAMLRVGPDGMTGEMAAAASQWTTLKWSLSLIGLVALLVGFAVRLRRRWGAG